MSRLTKNRQGIYEVRYQSPHGERRTSLGTSNFQEAQQLVKDANVDQLESVAKVVKLSHTIVSQLTSGRKLTLAVIMPEYVSWMKRVSQSVFTIQTTTAKLNAWMKEMEIYTLAPSMVTEAHVSDWINVKNDKKLKTRTGLLGLIRCFLKYCADKGYCVGNQASLVKVDMSLMSHQQKEPEVRSIVTPEQFESLLGAAGKSGDPEFWKNALLLGYYAGLRISDVCNFEWESMKEPGTLIVWTGKTDARVSVPIPEVLSTSLSLIPRFGNGILVWPVAAGWASTPGGKCKIGAKFRALCAACGVTGVSFHCLRHTYATNMEAQGIAIPHIASRMGHRNTETTEGYIHRAQPV